MFTRAFTFWLLLIQTCWGSVHVAHPLVNAGLDALLEELGGGGGREVRVHHDVLVRLVLLEERVDEGRLR